MSGFRERSYYPMRPQFEKMTVRTGTLDGSLPAGYRPALIKIDTEGAERLVIQGAIQTISKYRPIVRFFDLDGNVPCTSGQFEESFVRCERWNYVARP